MNEISVVVPVYNESSVIKASLTNISAYFSEKIDKYEIIVVDDGSSDNTVEIANSLNLNSIKVISYSRNRGKGYAVKKGVLAAKYNYVLFMDADLATPPEEIEKMAPYTDDFDIVIASRMLPTSKIKQHQPVLRRLLGVIGKKIISLTLTRGIKDTQCGFKLFKTDIAKKLFSMQKTERWGFDFEILFIAQKLKYKIKEVPVVWYAMEDSKLKFLDYISTLYDLIKLRLRRYSRPTIKRQ